MYWRCASRSKPRIGASCGRLLMKRVARRAITRTMAASAGSRCNFIQRLRESRSLGEAAVQARAARFALIHQIPPQIRTDRHTSATNAGQAFLKESLILSGPDNVLPARTIGPSIAKAAFCHAAPRQDACQVESLASDVPS